MTPYIKALSVPSTDAQMAPSPAIAYHMTSLHPGTKLLFYCMLSCDSEVISFDLDF